MPKLQYSCKRYSLTVPESIVKLLSWKQGDTLEFKIEKGRIYIEKEKEGDQA